jgi:mono/diheme cytochrome c family protein
MNRLHSGNSRLLALGFLMVFAFGCGGGPKSTTEPTQNNAASPDEQASPAAQAANGGAEAPDAGEEAKEIFATRCASCHGDEGRGNGPASAVLNPKPQNFHDPKWQTTVSDEQLSQAIIYGGSAVGKSPAMAPNPDLQEKPQVVKDLIAHIRALGKQK